MSSFVLKVRCCNFDIDFASSDEAAKFFGIHKSLICNVCNDRTRHTLNGLVFMYIN